MSNSRSRRPSPLSLDSQSDVPSGQSTQSTTVSEVQRATAVALIPINRPAVPDSSPESSPSSVSDLEYDDSTVSSESDLVSDNALHNAFLARRERERNVSQLQAERSHSDDPQITPQISNHSLSDFYVESAPSQFHFPYEADAEGSRLLQDATRFVQSLQIGASEQASVPHIMLTESAEDRLPPRPEPQAVTTVDRIQRYIRRVTRRGIAAVDEGTEMTATDRTSVYIPRQSEESVANVV